MFFILSKVFWFVANPANFLLILLCIGVVLMFTWSHKWGRRIVAMVAAIWLVLAVLPIGTWMFLPLENRFPIVTHLPKKVDGIIALGGVVNQFVTKTRGQVAVGAAAERLIEFAVLVKRYPNAKAVYSTGSGSLMRQDIKEADVVGPLMKKLGLDPSKIIFENQSRNTHENAILSKELAKPEPGETWVLITSAFHMPRSVGVFRKAGWTIIPYPVDYYLKGNTPDILNFNPGGALGRFSTALHEWIGLLVYRLTDRSNEIFPGEGGVGKQK